MKFNTSKWNSIYRNEIRKKEIQFIQIKFIKLKKPKTDIYSEVFSKYRISPCSPCCTTLENGNHDCNLFYFTIFWLDWVLNVLARYLDTHGTGVGAHTIELVREARKVVNTTVHHNIDTFQVRGIFKGRCGQPKLMFLESSWNFCSKVHSTPHKLLPF